MGAALELLGLIQQRAGELHRGLNELAQAFLALVRPTRDSQFWCPPPRRCEERGRGDAGEGGRRPHPMGNSSAPQPASKRNQSTRRTDVCSLIKIITAL